MITFLSICLSIPFNTSTVYGAMEDPTPINSQEEAPKELIDNVQSLEKYIVVGKNNELVFDVEKAEKDGATPEQLAQGREFNKFSSQYSSANVKKSRIKPGLPIYGNWCGPGHGGKSMNNPKPENNLDYRCMEHDLCYAKVGYFHCTCDRNLLWGILKSYPYMKSGEKAMATTVYTYFLLQMKARFCGNIDMPGAPR